eukprot:TRINITY_DN3945_c0_g1_i3.p1 TRINITY_DN3945_c0_g1~~TRINITY_DN3945_c0_g1_i3.p1  ORF type:complete len:116 (-),score=15.81 TRINITY_DN3945_c0_g1_i3:283-630(-)
MFHMFKKVHVVLYIILLKILKNKKQIADKGGIEAIIQAINNHPNVSYVQEGACRALYNLAEDPQNVKHIADKGGIEAIKQAMNNHPQDPRVQLNGKIALHNLKVNKPLLHRMLGW